MKLSFPAPFFGSFFGRAKNEQMNRVQKMNNKIIIIKIFHEIKKMLTALIKSLKTVSSEK